MMARPGATLALLAALCMAAANALRPGLPDILAAPWEGCEMRKARKACLGYKGCAWCTVTGEDEALCFGAATAAKLPPSEQGRAAGSDCGRGGWNQGSDAQTLTRSVDDRQRERGRAPAGSAAGGPQHRLSRWLAHLHRSRVQVHTR